MEINQKVAGGLMSRFFVKTPVVRAKSTSASVKTERVRVIPPFYVFVSTKKDKQEDGSILESYETKFRLSKEFTEKTLRNRVGTMDIEEPILFLFSPDSDIKASLFKPKAKKAKEVTEGEEVVETEKEIQATVFRFEPLVDNLKVNGVLPENYGQKDDENFILDITDITEAYLGEVADEDKEGLPADFSVFKISKGTQVEKEDSSNVVETKSANETVENEAESLDVEAETPEFLVDTINEETTTVDSLDGDDDLF